MKQSKRQYRQLRRQVRRDQNQRNGQPRRRPAVSNPRRDRELTGLFRLRARLVEGKAPAPIDGARKR